MEIVRGKWKRAKPPKLNKMDVKALVRHRDGYRCQECGITARQHVKRHGRSLDVHRLEPGSRYTVRGCITLCVRCHGPQPKRQRGTIDRDNPLFVCVALPQEYHHVLSELAKDNHRSITGELLVALDDFFRKKGRQPPPRT